MANVASSLTTVSRDLTRIERVLVNLIDNAIKYSPNGGEVKVSARREGNQVVVSVADQGIGIVPGDQEKLCHAFTRLETVPGTAIQGVGFGLVVCKRLVEAAEQSDEERKNRGPRGPLHGIPVVVKDSIATKDRMPTTAGTAALESFMSSKDAFLVARLRTAGAIILSSIGASGAIFPEKPRLQDSEVSSSPMVFTESMSALRSRIDLMPNCSRL